MSKACKKCHTMLEQKTGSFEHIMVGKTITVENVFYYECSSCHHIFYDDSEELNKQLENAYLAGKTNFHYENPSN